MTRALALLLAFSSLLQALSGRDSRCARDTAMVVARRAGKPPMSAQRFSKPAAMRWMPRSRWLRAGGDASVRGQHRRRRIHAGPPRRRAHHVHRFPRARARKGVAQHVPRCRRAKPRATAWMAGAPPACPARCAASNYASQEIRQQTMGGTGRARRRAGSRGFPALYALAQVPEESPKPVRAVPRIEAHLPNGTQIYEAGETFVQPELGAHAGRASPKRRQGLLRGRNRAAARRRPWRPTAA